MDALHLHTFENVGKFKPGKRIAVTAVIATKKQYKKLLKRARKHQKRGDPVPCLPPMLRAHLYRCTGCGSEVYVPSDPTLPPQWITSISHTCSYDATAPRKEAP